MLDLKGRVAPRRIRVISNTKTAVLSCRLTNKMNGQLTAFASYRCILLGFFFEEVALITVC